VASRRETHGEAQGLCRGRRCHGRSRRGSRDVHGSRVRGSVHRLVRSGPRQPSGDSRAATTSHHQTPALAQRHHSDAPAEHHTSDRPFAPAVFQSRGPARHGRRASSWAAAIELEQFGATVLGFVARSKRRACPSPLECSGGLLEGSRTQSTVKVLKELSGRAALVAVSSKRHVEVGVGPLNGGVLSPPWFLDSPVRPRGQHTIRVFVTAPAVGPLGQGRDHDLDARHHGVRGGSAGRDRRRTRARGWTGGTCAVPSRRVDSAQSGTTIQVGVTRR